jgi:hypothetical protein
MALLCYVKGEIVLSTWGGLVKQNQEDERNEQ